MFDGAMDIERNNKGCFIRKYICSFCMNLEDKVKLLELEIEVLKQKIKMIVLELQKRS